MNHGIDFTIIFLPTILSIIDLLKIDQCLTYQLEKHRNNNFNAFARLLKLIVRKFGDSIIPEKTVITIQEWITVNEQENLKGPNSGKKHGRINRRADDNICFKCLIRNLVQLSNRSEVDRSTFIIVANTFAQLIRSSAFISLPKHFPYINLILDLEQKVRALYMTS